MFVVAQVIGGVLYANLFEWVAHKHILHGLGKKKDSFWHFHWTHHNRCRKSRRNHDPAYNGEASSHLPSHVKEMSSVGLLLAAHVPLLYTPAAPFAGTVIGMGCLYLAMHGAAHKFPAWGKKWMRHHYDHHMGKNQDANWGVTSPLADYILNTRVKYDYDSEGRPKL